MNSINLDELAPLVQALDHADTEARRWAEAAAVLRKRIQAAMGESTEAVVDGQLAFTWRHTGQFNTRRFTSERPDLAAKYMVTRSVDELDVDALRADHPELFTAYRARRFERKSNS